MFAAPQLPFANAAAYASYLQQAAQHRGVAYHCVASSRYEVKCHGFGSSNGVTAVFQYFKVGPHTVRICVTPGKTCLKRQTNATGV